MMARRGDAKPLCHVAHASVALPGVSLLPLSGDKSLVLCQAQWTTCEGNTQAGQTPGKLTLASRVEVAQGYVVPETPAV
jgi:hypothetical protein